MNLMYEYTQWMKQSKSEMKLHSIYSTVFEMCHFLATCVDNILSILRIFQAFLFFIFYQKTFSIVIISCNK